MSQKNDEEPDNDYIVEFTVRNDRYRGILIEQMNYKNDIYFFKQHDMPVQRHCEQIQRIIAAVGVQRSKNICVDTTAFLYEYFSDNKPCFKGCVLNSTKQQMEKLATSLINKEIGAKKRSATVAQNKGRKAEERNLAIWQRMKEADDHFRAERKRRMDAYAYGTGVVQNPPLPTATVKPVVRIDQTPSSSHGTVHPTPPVLQIDDQMDDTDEDL